MPKVKTNKSAKKRFRRRAHSFKRKRGHHSHLLTKKTRKHKRQLRKVGTISKADKKRIRRLVPY